MGNARGRSFRPRDLAPDQQALYDAIVRGPRSRGPGSVPLVDHEGRLQGPFNAFLLQPDIGQRLQALGSTLRYESSLPDRYREIAILVVASHYNSDFERYAHEPVASSLGMTDGQLLAVREGRHGELGPDDGLVADAAGELLREAGLTDSRYASLIALIGEAQIFELTTVVGYYSMLALQLRVFRVEVPTETDQLNG